MAGDSRKRKYYLEDIALDDAVRRFYSELEKAGALAGLDSEAATIDECLGRVTARPIKAPISLPHYHAAAMDGVAVHSAETVGATETSPLKLRIGPQAVWIDTGELMPAGFDAVVMVENVHQVDDSVIEIMASVAPRQHVRTMGEDIVASEMVLPQGHWLRAVDLGALAACGLMTIDVSRQPRVAVIPTGSELVEATTSPPPGKIPESNSFTIAGMVRECGGRPDRFPIVKDDREKIKAAIGKAAAGHDVVIVNAGSSAGSRDHAAEAIGDLGKVVVHGIAVRPGHPAILGVVGKTAVFGLPGYPVSTAMTFDLLVKPLICRLMGVVPPYRPHVDATMTRKVLSPMGEDEFMRVRVGYVGGRFVTTPLPRGAGMVNSLVRADGIVRIPRFSEGVAAGEQVDVELLKAEGEIRNTIVAIGSHDLSLDLLANYLHVQHPRLSLSSANVGSMGGLFALKKGEAHLAGSHLLDEKSGEYNAGYVRETLAGEKVVLVNLVHREQGLIVARGNPRGLGGLKDLAGGKVVFVNRQRGSGTRVLLDYLLGKAGLSPDGIRGYETEEFTHLSVASAVAGGMADAGMGIRSAAVALGLDFIPVSKEKYDLVMLKPTFDSELLKPLLSILSLPGFRRDVQGLGGYDVSDMGKTVFVE